LNAKLTSITFFVHYIQITTTFAAVFVVTTAAKKSTLILLSIDVCKNKRHKHISKK